MNNIKFTSNVVNSYLKASNLDLYDSEVFYLSLFNKIPHEHYYYNIDVNEIKKFIKKHNFSLFKEERKEFGDSKLNTNKLYFVKDNYLLCILDQCAKHEFYEDPSHIILLFSDINIYDDELREYIRVAEKDPNSINLKFLLYANNKSQFVDQKIDISQKIDNIELLYGTNFVKIHDKILDSLNAKKPGLIMFTGATGTGKTSFIRYLVSKVCDRDFIFIPSSAISSLADPSFLSLFLSSGLNKPVLILEDAEKAIVNRIDNNNSESVSTLLNLTDGFIAEILNTTAIVTYNCGFDKVDQALIRKGRLLAKYEFKKLSIADSQKLLDHLKIDHKAVENMSIADVFNLKTEVDFSPDLVEGKKRIGF